MRVPRIHALGKGPGADIRIQRLTENARHLARYVSARSADESERLAAAVRVAREESSATTPRGASDLARPRAAVVAWDLTHNPAGRAYVLYKLLERDYDVELVGPMWSSIGERLWSPLAASGLVVRSFRCRDLVDFYPKAHALAANQVYDLVVVSKPRLPSLFLGRLLSWAGDCPLVCDVDDFEPAFFDSVGATTDERPLEAEALRADDCRAMVLPYDADATRYAQSLVSHCDAVTVSNVALRQRFGGHVVRHARSEESFCNDASRRAKSRERLGITDDDYALVFVGTPRAHKGAQDVVAALHELDDPKAVLHVVGGQGRPELAGAMRRWPRARVVLHPNCAFNELPDLLAGADLIPLLQDIEHPVSRFQIPAKISDALALGVPVLATEVAPLADLIAAGSVRATTPERLAADIAELKAERALRPVPDAKARRYFLDEFGTRVNRVRLDNAIAEATERYAERSHLPDGDIDRSGLTAMTALLTDGYIACRQAARQPAIAGSSASRAPAKSPTPGAPNRRVLFSLGPMSTGGGYDIVFFWKQNDSGLYGRRSDMLVRHLAGSGRVNRLLQLDAPIPAPSLEQLLQGEVGSADSQGDLILKMLVDRQLGLHDTDVLRQRTFVGSDTARRGRFVDAPVAANGTYIRYVREQLERLGCRPERTIAWFCPVIPAFGELLDKVGFAGVVVDVIDDQRGWETNPERAAALTDHYREALERADLAIANCESLAGAMREFRRDIHVIPNGAERPLPADIAALRGASRPERLAGIDGPIAGYVGTLRDRIDWLMLQDVAVSMPEVSFVLFGPGNDSDNACSLAEHPNVHLPGPLPYVELARHLEWFDVALLPHVDNRLTSRMNPLKLYNYFAAGLRTVATPVANLEDLGEALIVAADVEAFRDGIRQAIAQPLSRDSAGWQETMDRIAWDARVNRVLALLDERFAPRFARSA